MEFTPDSLVNAVRQLFILNQYNVKLSHHIHGAEVDMCVQHKADQFAKPIYIEITTQYVNTEKYGKDCTKFIMIKTLEPQARCMIISSSGFTNEIVERATESNIDTLTYNDLAKRFEQFDPYLTNALGMSAYANEIAKLSEIYEEPYFIQGTQKEKALSFLNKWKEQAEKNSNWLFVVGDYGTGKTALTKVIQKRWLSEYYSDRSLPIPIRIELRDFTKQFGATGLIHHFLDSNGLGYVSIDYVFELLRTNRIILILDGYDEMAQYMNTRERKTCLEALVELSRGGAKGIITSRPNYFTEAEELQIFNILYKDILSKVLLLAEEKEEVNKKLELNSFVQHHFSERIEKRLKDLDQDQTKALINRVLVDDDVGRANVISIINNIYSSSRKGDDDIELSGKPVIITYLMDVVEELKENKVDSKTVNLSLWKIYELIINMLMFRDFKRSENVTPDERKKFLHELSIFISSQASVIYEKELKSIVEKVFDKEIKKKQYSERDSYIDVLFSDMRSSTTLTRFESNNGFGWRFSHNTLKEYLTCESILESLQKDQLIIGNIKYTDLMKELYKSISKVEKENILSIITKAPTQENNAKNLPKVFNLLYPSLLTLFEDKECPHEELFYQISNKTKDFKNTEWDHISVGISLKRQCIDSYDFGESMFTDVVFKSIDFKATNISYSIFDSCRFIACNFKNMTIRDSDFSACTFIDCHFSNTIINIDKNASSIISEVDGIPAIKTADFVIGYFKWNGALIEESVDRYYEVVFDVRYVIMEKIAQRLFDQAKGQILGLTQRGASSKNVVFAKRFLDFMLSQNYLRKQKKDIVEVTETGRLYLSNILINKKIDDDLYNLYKE